MLSKPSKRRTRVIRVGSVMRWWLASVFTERSITGKVLLLSVFTVLYMFILCLWAHFIMFYFYIADQKINDDFQYRKIFIEFIFLNALPDKEQILPDASRVFKLLLMFSFFAPGICFLYKKFNRMNIIFLFNIFYCILGNIFLVYFYFRMDIISIWFDSNLIYKLQHIMLISMYIFLSLMFFTHWKVLSDSKYSEVKIKLTSTIWIFIQFCILIIFMTLSAGYIE